MQFSMGLTTPFMAIEIAPEQEIWVLTGEGAELTGYSHEYLEKMANKNWRIIALNYLSW